MNYLALPYKEYIISPRAIRKNDEFTVRVQGSKHTFLYCFLVGLFLDRRIVFENIPLIADTDFAIEYAKYAGAEMEMDKKERSLVIKRGICINKILPNYAINCRSALLAFFLHGLFFKEASVISMIGGCKIGDRKIDQHIKLWEKCGFIYTEDLRELSLLKVNSTNKETLEFDIDTTMGSVAAIYALVFNELEWVKNISPRPEIMDLISFLQKCGIGIIKKGNTIYKIQNDASYEKSVEIRYRISDDYDEAIGWACLFHVLKCRARVFCKLPEGNVFHFLEQYSNGEISRNSEGLVIRPKGGKAICQERCEIETGSFPQIGSDQQPILAIWGGTIAKKVCITEKRFPNRFNYLKYLSLYGWKWNETQGTISISYEEQPSNIPVLICPDLRASFAYLIAIAIMNKSCILRHAEQLFRGYAHVISNLESIGWEIEEILHSDTSAAIILKDSTGKFWMQQRDSNCEKNPNMISFFGGAQIEGETPEENIKREIQEELEMECDVELIGEYCLNESAFSTNGVVSLFCSKVPVNITICNEGNVILENREELLYKNLTLFSRCILEIIK